MNTASWVIFSIILFIVLVVAWMAVMPIYTVWSQKKKGEADLAQAKSEQNIQVTKAQSRLDAADLNKRAAIIEAEAVSEQIKTIGDTLTEHDLYLRWQWIKMMEERDGNTIYVPTEANLPILEARK